MAMRKINRISKRELIKIKMYPVFKRLSLIVIKAMIREIKRKNRNKRICNS